MRSASVLGIIVLGALVLLEILGACTAPIVLPMPPTPLVHRADTMNLAANIGPHGFHAYGGYGLDSASALLFGLRYATPAIGVADRSGYGMEVGIGRYSAGRYSRGELYAGLGLEQVSITANSSHAGNYTLGSAFVQGNIALVSSSDLIAQLGLTGRLSYHHILSFVSPDVMRPDPLQSGAAVLSLGPFARLGWKHIALELGLGLSFPLYSSEMRVSPMPMSLGVYIQP